MLICNDHTLYVNRVWLYCTLWLETRLTFWKLYRQFLLKCFFFVRNSQKSWCAVLERLMEDDSSQCDRRFFLPIISPFHRRPISWGLAGLANRELRWWQGCGQPRFSLLFNESSLVPSPITNLPAPWWIIIWEEKTSSVLNAHRQWAERPELITRASLWLRICFWFTRPCWGLFLALRQTDPLKSSLWRLTLWRDLWRFEWSVRLSKSWWDICHRAGLQQ